MSTTIENDYNKLNKFFSKDEILNRPKTAFKTVMQKPVNILHNIDLKKLPALSYKNMITSLNSSHKCINYSNELEIRGSNKKKGEKQRITFLEFKHKKQQISKDCKFYFIPIGLNNYGGSSHANLLILDLSSKTLEHFEPWGGDSGPMGMFDKKDYKKIKEVVEKEYHIHITQIFPSSETCPTLGLQKYENRFGEDTKLDLYGYCHYWGIIFLEAKLRNPTLSSFELQNIIIQEIQELNIDPRVYVRDYIIYNYSVIYRVLQTIYDYFPKLRKEQTYIVVRQYCDLIQCILTSDCFRSQTLLQIIKRYNTPSIEFKQKFKNLDINININNKKLQYISGRSGSTVPFITITSPNPYKYLFSEYGTENKVLNNFKQQMLAQYFPITDQNCFQKFKQSPKSKSPKSKPPKSPKSKSLKSNPII